MYVVKNTTFIVLESFRSRPPHPDLSLAQPWARHDLGRAFAALFDALACFKIFAAFLATDLEVRRAPRYLPDSGIPCQDEFAGAQSRLLEILRIRRKNLPARHLFAEQPNGPHVREISPQTRVVLLGGGQPDPVVFRAFGLVAENKDYLIPNVNREAAEHGARLGRQWRNRVEHELKRDGFALPAGEYCVVQREEVCIATGLRHTNGESRFVHFCLQLTF